jgi:putative flippase GtrA
MGRAALGVRKTSAELAARFAVVGMIGAAVYVVVHIAFSALGWLRASVGSGG